MFPPTHRIYRSIRPRNRFIIANKRRGLQTVSAICISLIFIIYGLETIYTMYDQYDFESQNFESEKRRLPVVPADDEGDASEDGDVIRGASINNPENANTIYMNKRFSTKALDGPTYFYSYGVQHDHDGAVTDSPWQWFEKYPGSQSVTPVDFPPASQLHDLQYFASNAGHTRQAGRSKEDTYDLIQREANFVAIGSGQFIPPFKYFYSFRDDQWWRMDIAATGSIGLKPNEPKKPKAPKKYPRLQAVDKPPEQDYTIAFKISEVDHATAAAVEARLKEDKVVKKNAGGDASGDGTDDRPHTVTDIPAPAPHVPS